MLRGAGVLGQVASEGSPTPGRHIDPISYSRPYYVGPGGPEADRSYVLLVEALARTGHVAVAKIAIRSRERLALLRPRHGILGRPTTR
ncbi:Ku protein [Streptomyces sp. 5K101]|uniref:Ku protein n=1 Tax=Streptomyces sp. 5K101 TaxID=3390037 RepID=UPI003976D6E1